jgi:FkbM family methyltransferase
MIRGYVRHSPVQKGKWRLLEWSTSFLLAEPERGTFLRISDLKNPVELSLIHKGLLEPQDVSLFLSLLRPGMTVLDVGANVGMYTLLGARRVGPAGRVHAFEPTPRVATALRRNVALNGLDNVIINEAAVGAVAGTATFFLQEASDRNTLGGGVGTPMEVKTITLDGYVTTAGVAKVDVMKMDVEGAEVAALQGGRELFSREEAPVLFLEVNPEALEAAGTSATELHGLLKRYGYLSYPLQTYGGGRYGNVLACKPWHSQLYKHLPLSGGSQSRDA